MECCESTVPGAEVGARSHEENITHRRQSRILCALTLFYTSDLEIVTWNPSRAWRGGKAGHPSTNASLRAEPMLRRRRARHKPRRERILWGIPLCGKKTARRRRGRGPDQRGKGNWPLQTLWFGWDPLTGADNTRRHVGLGRRRGTSDVASLQGGCKAASRRAGAVSDGRGGRACNQKAKAGKCGSCPRTATREAGGQSAASRTKTGGAAVVAIRTTPFLTEIQQQQGQRIWQGLRRRPWWRRPRRPWRPRPRAWPRRQPRKELEPSSVRREKKVNETIYGSDWYFCIIIF